MNFQNRVTIIFNFYGHVILSRFFATGSSDPFRVLEPRSGCRTSLVRVSLRIFVPEFTTDGVLLFWTMLGLLFANDAVFVLQLDVFVI